MVTITEFSITMPITINFPNWSKGKLKKMGKIATNYMIFVFPSTFV